MSSLTELMINDLIQQYITSDYEYILMSAANVFFHSNAVHQYEIVFCLHFQNSKTDAKRIACLKL